LAEVEVVEAADRDRLLGAARALNRGKVPNAGAGVVRSAVVHGRKYFMPYLDFNSRGTWAEVLEPAGWTDVGRGLWRRPGKFDGASASADYYPGYFHVFTTGVPELDAGRSYTRSQLFAHLHCGGDFGESNARLQKIGYGFSN
jgi:hypothetical protein